jgi:MFS transporter, MHS family, proline/betaine transporter
VQGVVSLLMPVATFGIGAVMSPIGALVRGIYGDRIARKDVMSLTFFLFAAGGTATLIH